LLGTSIPLVSTYTRRKAGSLLNVDKALAEEAITFLKAKDLITIPPLAEEIWRMEMLSPRQQLVSP